MTISYANDILLQIVKMNVRILMRSKGSGFKSKNNVVLICIVNKWQYIANICSIVFVFA